MEIYNYCKKNKIQRQKEVYRWAKRLEADQMIIHKDCSITLDCKYGNICERYYPTSKELYKSLYHKTERPSGHQFYKNPYYEEL